VADDQKQAPEGISAEQAAEQLKALQVADLVVQAASGFISLGFLRLGGEQRDLAQARLAIDSLRALEPVVRDQISAELADELQRARAGMQLAFAEAVNEKTEPAGPAAPAPEAESDAAPAAETPDSGS
jgi:hypothetical protein